MIDVGLLRVVIVKLDILNELKKIDSVRYMLVSARELHVKLV